MIKSKKQHTPQTNIIKKVDEANPMAQILIVALIGGVGIFGMMFLSALVDDMVDNRSQRERAGCPPGASSTFCNTAPQSSEAPMLLR